MDTIDQLINIYLNKETWHRTKLTEQDARQYFETILKHGRLLYHTIDDNIVGYVEWYNIDYDQFRRIVNREPFDIGKENITDGRICYIMSVWIEKPGIAKVLKQQFFEANKHCEYFAGREINHNRRLSIRRNCNGRR